MNRDASPATPGARTAAGAPAPVRRIPHILLVDDNEQNLELLEAYLEELEGGAVVSTATDGIEALRRITGPAEPGRPARPDLILLDIMMPRMSGYQLCARLKADPKTRDIPIIMVTALNEVGDMEKAREAGAADFITKPVHKPDLLAKVKERLASTA